jgi:hypothetical protein
VPLVLDSAAGHVLYKPFPAEFCRRPLRCHSSVAQNGNRIADIQHLLDLMAYEYEGRAAGLERLDDRK